MKGNYAKWLMVAFSREWDYGTAKSNFYARYQNDLLLAIKFLLFNLIIKLL